MYRSGARIKSAVVQQLDHARPYEPSLGRLLEGKTLEHPQALPPPNPREVGPALRVDRVAQRRRPALRGGVAAGRAGPLQARQRDRQDPHLRRYGQGTRGWRSRPAIADDQRRCGPGR